MDEGAEITQQGVPISQASDDQKVLDTRWVTLNIFAEPTYSNTITLNLHNGLTTNIIVVYSHNLGYPPAFDYQINSISVSDGAALITATNLYADSNNIYLIPQISIFNPPATLTISLNLRVYTLNITTNFQAPTVNTISSVNPTQSNYGIEFPLPADVAPQIGNLPVNEYSFSTRLKPLNILQNGTVTASNGSISISYSYPKYPLYMLAQYFPNGYSFNTAVVANPLVGSLGFAGGQGTINSTTLTVSGVQSAFSGSYAYVLLKDPIGLKQ